MLEVPAILELLVDEQKSGQLHIHPVIIMTEENIFQTLCAQSVGHFTAADLYSCTEGGTIGSECSERIFM